MGADRAAHDASVRAVVLAASGRGFSAGHDLKEMRAHASDKTWQQALFSVCGRMMTHITGLPQPVIARVRGSRLPPDASSYPCAISRSRQTPRPSRCLA